MLRKEILLDVSERVATDDLIFLAFFRIRAARLR